MSDSLTPADLPEPEFEGLLSIDELDTDGENPNEMTDSQFGLLCERMEDNGWLSGPIITDVNGLIADGEHRYRAAQEIGLSEVPVRQFDIDDSTRRLWRQELNKIAGEHDPKRDALEYDELLSAGYTDEVEALTDAADEDLDDLLAELRVDSGVGPEYEYDPEHNVYFEDCVEGMRERLDDDSVDCVITDPPYGIDVNIDREADPSNPDTRSKPAKHRGDVMGDLDEDEALGLFRDVMAEVSRVLKPTGHLYVFASWKTSHLFRSIIEDSQVQLRNRLIWRKDNPVTMHTWGDGLPSYAHRYEDIWFACGPDAAGFGNTPIDVLEHTDARFADGESRHPTQKPVSVISDMLTNSTQPGDTVLDPFMGSGTTAVAAIQNDRDYVGFEVDAENYRDVIERRIGEAKRQREASVNSDNE